METKVNVLCAFYEHSLKTAYTCMRYSRVCVHAYSVVTGTQRVMEMQMGSLVSEAIVRIKQPQRYLSFSFLLFSLFKKKEKMKKQEENWLSYTFRSSTK